MGIMRVRGNWAALVWVETLCGWHAQAAGYERVYEDLRERRMPEIIVGITTTPRRLVGALHEALLGIFNQKLPPNKVILALPRGALRRKPEEKYPADADLPAFLSQISAEHPSFVLDRDCQDDGPGTVLICALKHASSLQSVMVTWPDDVVYSRDHLATLVHMATAGHLEGYAVSVVGTHSKKGFPSCVDGAVFSEGCVGRRYYGHEFGPIPIGWMCTLVRPWFFGPTGRLQAAEQPEWPDECRNHDDLWLGAMLARRGIRRTAFNGGLMGHTNSLAGSKGGTALLTGNRWNLLRCNEALLARWPQLWDPRPRVVIVADQSVWTSLDIDGLTRCVGPVDEMYNVIGMKPSTTFMAEAISAVTAHENEHSVALALRRPWMQMSHQQLCQQLSAALQCAFLNPDNICKATDAAFVAAASLTVWRRTKADQRSTADYQACWSKPNTSWGLCCGEQGDFKAIQWSLAKKRCPDSIQLRSKRCCTVDSRLTKFWAHLEGVWLVTWDQGERGRWHIHESGHMELTSLDGSVLGRARLEKTPLEGIIHVVPLGEHASQSTEIWRLDEGRLQSVAMKPDGGLRTASAEREDERHLVGVV